MRNFLKENPDIAADIEARIRAELLPSAKPEEAQESVAVAEAAEA